jgi:cytochrome c oxidase cbb3-type subunit III
MKTDKEDYLMANREEEHLPHSIDGIVENKENPPPRAFSLLFIGLVVWGVLFMAYYLLSGWSSQQEFQENMADHQQRFAATAAPVLVAQIPEQERLLAGAAIFTKDCTMCHGADGHGGIGSDLTAGAYHFGHQPTEVSESIRTGRPGGMPAFGQQYSAEEVENLTRFVLSLRQ